MCEFAKKADWKAWKDEDNEKYGEKHIWRKIWRSEWEKCTKIIHGCQWSKSVRIKQKRKTESSFWCGAHPLSFSLSNFCELSFSFSYFSSYVRMCVFSFFYATLLPLECELLQCNGIYLIIAISIALFSISHFSLSVRVFASSDFLFASLLSLSWLLQEAINFISVIVSAWGPFSIPFLFLLLFYFILFYSLFVVFPRLHPPPF